ncbi:NAD(P)H-dependent oxidoreductase subunit E [Planctomycetota bacterium]
MISQPPDNKKGSVLVIGGGIAGMQAALDCANSGLKAYLLEEQPAIGGNMAQLDKTFPTNDCSICMLSPKLVEVGRHLNIKIISYADLEKVEGKPGNFKVKVKRKARYIDEEKCTGCGSCVENCPVHNRISVPVRPRPEPQLDPETKTWLESILSQRQGQGQQLLVPVLHEVQRQYRHLPREVLEYVSWNLNVPLSAVLRVASFYNIFSLKPRGRHTISVCLGTACFVKGSGMLLEKIERELQIKSGETTADRLFTLEEVRCIGCCALAPAIRIDDKVYGHLTQFQIPKILKKYRNSNTPEMKSPALEQALT